VQAARLSDGRTIECDLVLAGIGVVPSVAWLGGEFALNGGVHTDEFCRTSVPDVFAAGDVACSWRPRFNRRLRFEHYDNAELQGAAAARAMCGTLKPYDPVPFFWSDQYDLSLQYYGNAPSWDRVVLRDPRDDGSVAAFYLNGGRIDAVCLLNRSRDATAAKRLIGLDGIDPDDLAGDRTPLKNLALAYGGG
jgi:3-phenylpropionate/trans-cinnamate dioxygenase ferredoxin reductase subunit